ncbi:MAG: CBS domain-containing protein [Planctomyces sp.]|nr:CBS domain-containing protein [Planctomyces sp.]
MVRSVVDLFQQLARNEFGFFARLQSVCELMSTTFSTVTSDHSLGDVVARRDPMQIGPQIVLDASKQDVIGLLKHSTILRCIPRYLNTLKEGDRDRAILATNVCDLVTRRSPVLPTTATPLDALEVMLRQSVDCILVYDDPASVKGIITPMNFACIMLLYYRVYHQLQPLQRLRLVDLDSDLSLDEIFCRGAQTSRDVMSSPFALHSREPVAAAIQLLHDQRASHVPLTDDNGQLCGVVSQNDILLALQPPGRPHLADFSVPLPAVTDLLASGHEPTLSEPVSSVARSRLVSVTPTTRLTETLALLTETGRDIVVVQEQAQFLGVVSLIDIVRVFRTLMRLQTIKGN